MNSSRCRISDQYFELFPPLFPSSHCSLIVTTPLSLGQPGYVVIDDSSDTCNNVPPNAFTLAESDRGGYRCRDESAPCPKRNVTVYSQEGELWGKFTMGE